jgi:hypothetical protein
MAMQPHQEADGCSGLNSLDGDLRRLVDLTGALAKS